MKGAPPLRFLGIVVGGWVCLRAAMLVPDWAAETELSRPDLPNVIAEAPIPLPSVRREPSEAALAPLVQTLEISAPPENAPPRGKPLLMAALAAEAASPPAALAAGLPLPHQMAPPTLDRRAPLAKLPGRWSGSAWAFVRRGSGAGLGAGSMLGGSQIGGRIGYRINEDVERPLALVARAYAPVDRRQASEAALGLEWKPVSRLPLRVLLERRQALGSEGRSAFAVTAHGGVSEVALPAGLQLDAYAQAGVVGARSRDLFADGSVALALPLDGERRLTIGGAVWGAAQPGVSRVDAGPRVSLKLPGAERVRVVADWRFRLHGNASPASGPSLTLATDF